MPTEPICENCGKSKDEHYHFTPGKIFWCTPIWGKNSQFKPKPEQLTQLPKRPEIDIYDSVKTVLDRESATTARYDARIAELEGYLVFWKRETVQLNALVRKLEKELREFKDSLWKLSNEASGFLGMADRQTHGNTNMAVLKMRIDDARALIEAARKEAVNDGELSELSPTSNTARRCSSGL